MSVVGRDRGCDRKGPELELVLEPQPGREERGEGQGCEEPGGLLLRVAEGCSGW